MNSIKIPELSLVALVGVSSSGKSTFAKKHFKPTEVLSSDFCRALVSDDPTDQNATKDAFEILHSIAAKRLAAGKLTVIDATNLQKDARKPILELARSQHCIPVAIVFDLPEKLCHERNQFRQGGSLSAHSIRHQAQLLRQSIHHLKLEGFTHIYILRSQEEVDQVAIERQRMWTNLKHEQGPFDIIGDIHGCYDELYLLLSNLGYMINGSDVKPPQGRKAIFLGDLVDRGPKTPEVLQLVMNMVESGAAFVVPGNHDIKLLKKLKGAKVTVAHGMEESLQQLAQMSPAFIERTINFLEGLISHYVLDAGNLVVAHAGLKEEFHGRGSGKVRAFALFGDVNGETDEEGAPVRLPWYNDYRGKALVVYGHTAILEPEFINRTINIDTGCIYGGKLTALRYPERELVSVSAAKVYAQPRHPLQNLRHAQSGEPRKGSILDIQDVLGKKLISTRYSHSMTLREESAPEALEFVSRFGIDPKWMIYIPPTMSPSKTSVLEEYLEHPTEAFEYFKEEGVSKVICEEKHMGSRAILVICKDLKTARKRFNEQGPHSGVIYSRTGRPFFNDKKLESAFLERMQKNLTKAGLWDSLKTDWICLDCEILPWSAKAQSLLKEEYAPVGASSQRALSSAKEALQRANLHTLMEEYSLRESLAKSYVEAYRHYCWPVESLDDYKIAPFHILATEGSTHFKKDHLWHLNHISTLCETDPSWIKKTAYRVLDINDPLQCSDACEWWLEMTRKGGEGMVVKPLDFTVFKDSKALVQPGIKVRGQEYLRIIYGPEYTIPQHLERLKQRNLGKKRALALKEFALGAEALERFVENEPFYRVHECVFATLALASTPTDPRL